MDMYGNDTQSSFDALDAANGLTEYQGCDLSLDVGVGNGSTCGQVYLMFNSWALSEDWSEALYSLKITIKRVSNDDVWEKEYTPGTWNGDPAVATFEGTTPTLQISVPNITANICEGSISNVSTVATVTNADASGAYTIALTDGGGASPFNPAYATVSGDDIQIAANCPAGNYTVEATVTDAAGNTANTTFSFVVNAKPDITISANPGTTICKGTPLTLSITDAENVANQYAWDAVGNSTDAGISASTNSFSSGNVTYTANPTATMKYQAIAKSAAGCLDTTELQITVNEAPTATLTASSTTICSGETITLTATPSAGLTADSWEWVNPSSAVTANTVTVTPVNTGNAPSTITYLVKSVKGNCKSTDFTATVTVNPKPALSVTAQPVAQCEGNQINLASAQLGGASGLTLSYYSDANCTNPTTSNFQTVALADSPKSFWVVGKNPTTGCSDTVELKATVNPNPTKPTISGPTEVCEGSTATLSVTGVAGATYKWYDAGGTQVGTSTSYTTPAFTAATSYKVEVEVGGCKTESDAYNVALNKKPTVTIPNIADLCAGSDVTVSASVSGGTSPYSNYVWSVTAAHGGATHVPNGAQVSATFGKGENTFTLTVSDAKGCTGTASKTAEGGYIQAGLSANPATFVESSSSSLTLTATATSGGNAGNITDYAYSQLSPVAVQLGSGTSTFNPPLPTAPTKYQVVMTTEKGCKDSATVQVSYTARDLAWDYAQGDTVCMADVSGGAVLRAKAKFGTTPYTYTWGNVPPAAGVLSQVVQGDSLVLTFDATTVTPGVYPVSVTLTDADNKSINRTVNLTIGATPDVKINGGVTGDLAVCLNSTLNLTASTSLTEGVSYLWKEPSTMTGATQSVSTTTVNTTGTTYKVIATSVYGCVDSVARKVIVNDLPTIILTADKGSVCPGGSVRVEVKSDGDNTEYTWTVGGVSDGEGKSKTKSISVATQFKVQREDANGCISTADTTIQVYVPQVLILSEDQTVCSEPAPTLTLTASGLTASSVLGSGEYAWSSTDGQVSGNQASVTVTPTATTTYYVGGTDVHGCEVARDSIVVTVDQMPTFNLDLHRLSACGSVKLYDAVGTVNPGGATLKYGSTPNFTGGTVFTSTSTLSASGLYYVRAENGMCKSAEDTVRVNILTAPQLELLATTMETCEPDSVDLAANIDWTGTTFDATNLTYWEGGTQLTSTKVYPGVTTKTYSVRGTSTGCPLETKDVTVTIHPKPVLEISVNDTAVCTPTADLNVAVNAKDGLAVTKTYFSDAAYSNAVAAAVPTGTYYVIGETAAGCKDSIEVTVRVKPHPVVTLTASADKVCENETVSLTVNGGGTGDTYSWKVDGTPATGTLATFTSAALTASTLIEVTVTNTEGCTTVLDTTIGIYTSNVDLVADGNCLGETVTITATLTGDGNATGYSWTGATQTATANEATLTLTSTGQTVEVEVTTDKGCKVKGMKEFTGRLCGVLVVEAPDTTLCLSGDAMVLTAHSFGGAVTNWTWTQIGGIAISPLTYTDSVLTLPSTIALGTYQFEVSVNGGVAKDTAEVTIQQGVTITSLLALDSCSSVVNLQVVAVNSTSYDWDVVSGNGIGYNVPGSPDKWELHLDGGHTEYTVAVKASNGVCEAHDTLTGHILDAGLDLAFRGNDTCGTNIELPIRYSVQGGSGDIVAKYAYQALDGTLTRDSIRITPPDQVSISVVEPGIYVLTGIYAINAPGCVVTVNDTLKIGALPEVELDENCLALHKDSTFNLNIANSGDFDYIWSVSESSDGMAWTAGGPGDGTTASTLNGSMEDKDLQYIITATDRNLPQCKASDTAHIYRIPDAPVIDIDTIGDRYHAQVIWTPSNVADGYTVWSRRWDPYCLTTAYTGDTIYHAEPTGTNIPDTSWPEPNMDSLKFFYVTADINVCGSWYNSLSSTDTVGYKLDSLLTNTDGRTSNNPVMWVFDRPEIQNAGDLMLRLGEWQKVPTAIRRWVINDQATSDACVFEDTYWMFVQMGLPTTGFDPFINPFDLTVGEVYEIAVLEKTQLLQYGKLSAKIEYQLNNSPEPLTDNNMTALALHHADYLEAFELIEYCLKPQNVSKGLYMWNFAEQAWVYSTTYSGTFESMLDFMSEEDIINMGIPKYDITGEYKIYPTLPIQVDASYMRSNNIATYIWK
ncbi:MAG: hypothetical protein NC410_03215 [Oscillibacter sp.]|nr:hypothetical protein [Oscillibacter sp.]